MYGAIGSSSRLTKFGLKARLLLLGGGRGGEEKRRFVLCFLRERGFDACGCLCLVSGPFGYSQHPGVNSGWGNGLAFCRCEIEFICLLRR